MKRDYVFSEKGLSLYFTENTYGEYLYLTSRPLEQLERFNCHEYLSEYKQQLFTCCLPYKYILEIHSPCNWPEHLDWDISLVSCCFADKFGSEILRKEYLAFEKDTEIYKSIPPEIIKSNCIKYIRTCHEYKMQREAWTLKPWC